MFPATLTVEGIPFKVDKQYNNCLFIDGVQLYENRTGNFHSLSKVQPYRVPCFPTSDGFIDIYGNTVTDLDCACFMHIGSYGCGYLNYRDKSILHVRPRRVYCYGNEVPYNMIYIRVSHGLGIFEFQRLDDYIANTPYSIYQKAITLYNMRKRFDELMESSGDLNMVEEIKIICSDSEFIFTPSDMPIARCIKDSLFNVKHGMVNDIIRLEEYDLETVKGLFDIFTSVSLPTELDAEFTEVYCIISDYLGLEFYTEYFSALTE